MRNRLSILALAAATILAGAIPASAAQVTDPDDTAGPLDVKTLRVDQGSNGILHVRISTYGGWSKKLLKQSGPHRWFVSFDTEAGGGPEYTGRIAFANGSLYIHIKGSGSDFENLPVKKPSARTLAFTVPGGAPMTPKGVGIATKTRYVDVDNTYKDRAPDAGFVSDT